MASSSAQASSSAPATALAAALADLERTSTSSREGDTYAPKLRGWLHGLENAARPIAPPAPDLRWGSEEMKAARRAAHEAAKRHRQKLHATWKEAGPQRRAAYMKEYDATRDWQHVREAAQLKQEDARRSRWLAAREEQQPAVARRREELAHEAAKAAANAETKWQELCSVLTGCGLGRLANERMRGLLQASVIVPALHGPAQGLGPLVECEPHREPKVRSVSPSSQARSLLGFGGTSRSPHVMATSVLCALTAYLNKQDGFAMRDEVESRHAGSCSAALQLTRDEAAVLHRSIVRARFESFLHSALKAINNTEAAGGAEGARERSALIVHAHELFDALYNQLYQCPGPWGQRWVDDLDLVAMVGEIYSGALSVEGLSSFKLEEMLRASILDDAADALLQLARRRAYLCMVLKETLPRREAYEQRLYRGNVGARDRMVAMLESPRMGAHEGHVRALLHYLGQLEFTFCGTLWKAFPWVEGEALQDGLSPGHLCQLVSGMPECSRLLATWVFNNSQIFGEPVRAFLCYALARNVNLSDAKLVCTVLAPIAIADPSFAILAQSEGRLPHLLLIAFGDAVECMDEQELSDLRSHLQSHGGLATASAETVIDRIGPYLDMLASDSAPHPPSAPRHEVDLEYVAYAASCNDHVDAEALEQQLQRQADLKNSWAAPLASPVPPLLVEDAESSRSDATVSVLMESAPDVAAPSPSVASGVEAPAPALLESAQSSAHVPPRSRIRSLYELEIPWAQLTEFTRGYDAHMDTRLTEYYQADVRVDHLGPNVGPFTPLWEPAAGSRCRNEGGLLGVQCGTYRLRPPRVELRLSLRPDATVGASVEAFPQKLLEPSRGSAATQYWGRTFLCVCDASLAEVELVRDARDDYIFFEDIASSAWHRKNYLEPLWEKERCAKERRERKRERGEELTCGVCKRGKFGGRGYRDSDTCSWDCMYRIENSSRAYPPPF
jgi:hypothetical protein